eukprot:11262476-Alexandrium_andersonii.AAC.1
MCIRDRPGSALDDAFNGATRRRPRRSRCLRGECGQPAEFVPIRSWFAASTVPVAGQARRGPLESEPRAHCLEAQESQDHGSPQGHAEE